MFGFRRRKSSATAMSALMGQTHDLMVCFEFTKPIDIKLRGDALVQKLRDAQVVEASARFARYFGYKDRESIIGVHVMDLIHGVVPDWFIGYGVEVADSGYKDLERIVKVPVGDSTRYMRIHMQTHIENDYLTGQWITIRDVSEEHTREHDLKTSERTKSLALQAAHLHTFNVDLLNGTIDMDSSGLGDIDSSDKSVAEWGSRIVSDDLARSDEDLKEFLTGKSDNLHLTFRVLDKHDHPRWIEVWGLATGRDEDGVAKGITGVYKDITEIRELQTKVQSVQKLETLGRLAGGVAHDFNNLLMTIMGSAELARLDRPDQPDAYGEDALARIVAATQQASELCHQLLAYSGRGTMVRESLELAGVVTKMLGLLRTSIRKDTQINFHDISPVWVLGDATQMAQIVMNLVQNASEALLDEPGEITVSVGRCQYQDDWQTKYHMGTELKHGDYGYVEVTDTGTGMSPDQLERMFDPFFTTKFTGRGIGMAVVLGVVRAHHGGITVVSTPQIGTTVRVVIPHSNEVPNTESPSSGPSPNQLQGRALVVDDEPAVRTTVAQMLTTLGLQVASVEDASKAINRVKQENGDFDIILMDITMPGIDGSSAATILLDLYPDLNIILTSGYTSSELQERVSFIHKPYKLETLATTINDLLGF